MIKARALALRDFPRANGAYRDGQFELYSRVNVGVAVAGQDALVVPTVFDADKKSLGHDRRRGPPRSPSASATARSRRPSSPAGTFTISNLGMYGIRRFVAVINPPQAAILGGRRAHAAAGRARRRGRDPRADGAHARSATTGSSTAPTPPQFLAQIREYLEAPLKLAL